MLRLSQASPAGRIGCAPVSIAVSRTSPVWTSNSKLTVRKYPDVNEYSTVRFAAPPPAEDDLHPALGRERARRRDHVDGRVRERRAGAVLVPDRSLESVRRDPPQPRDPVDPRDERADDRPADRHLRVAAVDVEADHLPPDRPRPDGRRAERDRLGGPVVQAAHRARDRHRRRLRDRRRGRVVARGRRELELVVVRFHAVLLSYANPSSSGYETWRPPSATATTT